MGDTAISTTPTIPRQRARANEASPRPLYAMPAQAVARDLGAELRATMALALPLIGAQLSQILMGFTAAAMMGRLGGDSLAAGGLGAGLYFMAMLVMQGVLLAVGPMVGQARGAGEEHRIGGIVAHGMLIGLAASAAGAVAILNLDLLLAAVGQSPELVAKTRAFLGAVVWGLPGALGFALFRTYLSAVSRTWPIMVLLVACLGLNAALNYALIFGRFGAPALGIVGSGYATAIVQWIEFLGLALYAGIRPHLRRHRIAAALRQPRWGEARAILSLGWPIAGIQATEAGVFAATAVLAGVIGTAALAAHQVAVGVASVSFMIPLGFSQAATVRVAIAAGASELAAARRAGSVAFACGSGFMVLMAFVMLLAPGLVISLYLDAADPANAEAVAIARRLIFIAALFQVFDGTQTIAAGVLRGLKDTRVPLLVGAVGYWAIGFLAGGLLAFPLGLGAPGLWWGLALGLAAVALPLAARFYRLTAA